MERGERVLNTLLAINTISQERHLEFGQKLHEVLLEIVRCMEAKSGSVPVILITYATTEDAVRKALAAVGRDRVISGRPQVIRIEKN